MSVIVSEQATLPDIDEALRNLSLVPLSERGSAWHSYSDRVLELRARLEPVAG